MKKPLDEATEQTAAHGPEELRDGESPEMVRREFMKRFGVYAAGSALGLYVLMSAKTSAVAASDGTPP